MVKNLISSALLVCALVLPSVGAQTVSFAPGEILKLNAQEIDGTWFRTHKIRGDVAIVFFWSTACTVCRDSLPELRANLDGWRNKPFSLVTVNVDPSATDWLAYEKILSEMKAPSKALFALRQADGLPVPPKLPLTLVVDVNGKVVARYEGRVAPQAWDSVADLMP
jgi:thiol-disulfide isomerase/thioredoxin